MSAGKTVEILIDTEGQCRIDAAGFTDSTCVQTMSEILKGLDARVTKSRNKPEMRVPVQQRGAGKVRA